MYIGRNQEIVRWSSDDAAGGTGLLAASLSPHSSTAVSAVSAVLSRRFRRDHARSVSWIDTRGMSVASVAMLGCLYRELLPDLARVLGPDHPDTLANRREIARLAGED
jgi:hypothetical protein